MTNPWEYLDKDDPTPPVEWLVIGCGNLLRGDDAAGPIVIRRLWETPPFISASVEEPEGRLETTRPAAASVESRVRLADGGTSGMDVVFQMRHARKVILIDAAQTGKPAGTVFQVPGSVVEDLPDMPSVSSHDLRWDHALGMGHWLLGPYFPTQVEVFLIEAGGFEWGAPLTQPVSEAADRVVQLILQKVGLADASQPGTLTGIPTEQKQQGEASSEPEHHD